MGLALQQGGGAIYRADGDTIKWRGHLFLPLILLAHTDSSRMGLDYCSSAWGASAVILMFYKLFTRMLGEKGLTAVERLMGMVLVMISVQMFLDGVSNYMKTAG